MGDVDRSDQLLKYYEVVRITKKYWRTIFYHLDDLSAVNAFILHKIASQILKLHIFSSGKIWLDLSAVHWNFFLLLDLVVDDLQNLTQ